MNFRVFWLDGAFFGGIIDFMERKDGGFDCWDGKTVNMIWYSSILSLLILIGLIVYYFITH